MWKCDKQNFFFLIFKFSSNLGVFKLVMLHVEPYYLSFTKKWILGYFRHLNCGSQIEEVP